MGAVTADIDGGYITLKAPATYKDLLRQIPGARWHAPSQCWRAPVSWATCKAARGVCGERLEITEALQSWAVEEQLRIRRIERAKEGLDVLPTDLALYDFQQTGVTFLYEAERAILADEMGLGKTVEVIVAVQELHADGSVLVICTNSMKHKWAKEIQKWAPACTVQVVEGSAAKRRQQIAAEADWTIINWEGLRAHSRLAGYGSIKLTDAEKEPKELNRPWGCVIMDEAHRMKDPRAKQTRAAWAVAHEARYRFALTGTPIANSPEDIWAIGHAIAPEEYPSRTKFIDRYTRSSLNFWGALEVYGLNSATQEELFSFLDPRLLRRTKAEVLPQLPPKTYTERYVDLDPKQRKVYDQMADTMLAELDSGILLAGNVLTQTTRLLQAASAYPELDEEGKVAALTAPSCKVAALLDILDEAPGEPLVVFSPSRKLIELAHAELTKKKFSCGLITGGQSPLERQETVDAFQGGSLQVVLATTGAGGEGITLTAASRLVFLSRPWSAVQSVQAEDRIHRIGQEQAVEIIDVIALGTVEDRVHELLGWKADRLEEVVRDKVRELLK